MNSHGNPSKFSVPGLEKPMIRRVILGETITLFSFDLFWVKASLCLMTIFDDFCIYHSTSSIFIRFFMK